MFRTLQKISWDLGPENAVRVYVAVKQWRFQLEMVFQHSTVNSCVGNDFPVQHSQLQRWKSFSYTAKEIAAQQRKFPHCNCMIRQPVRQRNKAMRSPGEYRGCLAGASPGDPRHDGLATVA